ncbi:MAG: hypothetical protein HY699_04250 [Deltaproteobacteria bacterium]|nr:hypothetical protein [Deltaproteobacteria bacterium]
MLRWYVIALVIGVAGETNAYCQRLWVYRRPIYPVLNVLLMFGLVMGGLASMASQLGLATVFAIGFAVGVVYEIANLRWLHWWEFPGERLYFLRGHGPVVVAISLFWGGVPLLVAALESMTRGLFWSP